MRHDKPRAGSLFPPPPAPNLPDERLSDACATVA